MVETKATKGSDEAPKPVAAPKAPAKAPVLAAAAESSDPEVHRLLSMRQAAADAGDEVLAARVAADLAKLGVQ